MSKKKGKRMHDVRPPKSDSNKLGTITREDQLMLERKLRREDDIERDTFCRTGAHGGTVKEQNKRKRKDARQDCRKHTGDRGDD